MYHWKILCDGIVIMVRGPNGHFMSHHWSPPVEPLINNENGHTNVGNNYGVKYGTLGVKYGTLGKPMNIINTSNTTRKPLNKIINPDPILTTPPKLYLNRRGALSKQAAKNLQENPQWWNL